LDEAAHGFSYWHVSHQTPGIHHCSKHPQQLLLAGCSQCELRFNSLDNLELPPLGSFCPHCAVPFHVDSSLDRATLQLEADTKDWLEVPRGRISAEMLQREYVTAARDNFRIAALDIAPRSSIALCTLNRRLQPQFDEFYGKIFLAGVLESYRYRGEIRSRRLKLHRLMTTDVPIHPALHLLVIRFLFGSINRLKANASATASSRQLGTHPALRMLKTLRIPCDEWQ
jgi:hypothetical protein